MEEGPVESATFFFGGSSFPPFTPPDGTLDLAPVVVVVVDDVVPLVRASDVALALAIFFVVSDMITASRLSVSLGLF